MSHSSFLILLDKNPHIKLVDLLIIQLSGKVYRESCKVNEMESIIREGRLFPYDVFFQASNNTRANSASLKLDIGSGICWPVAPVRIPFEKANDQLGEQNNRAEILLSMTQGDKSIPYLGDPRQVLNTIMERFVKNKWQVVIDFQFSFALEDKFEPSLSQSTYENKCQEFIQEIEEICQRQHVPLSSPLAVDKDNQITVNFKANNNILSMADYAVIIKHILDQTAQNYGLITNIFEHKDDLIMSKLFVGISIYDEQGDNIFNDEHESCQRDYASFGLMNYMHESMLIFAPEKKDYLSPKEFKHDAKNDIEYSDKENTAAKNQLANKLKNYHRDNEKARIEHKVASLQTNPYLVLSAILSAISIGIEAKMDKVNRSIILPESYEKALKCFSQSVELTEYFGQTLLNDYQKYHCRK